jgi:hypothetical protein
MLAHDRSPSAAKPLSAATTVGRVGLEPRRLQNADPNDPALPIEIMMFMEVF